MTFAQQLKEEYKQEFMSTFAQQLEQKGLQQGLQQGLQKGREEGRHQEAIVIAKNMLLKRLDPKLIKEITGLSDQDLLSLED